MEICRYFIATQLWFCPVIRPSRCRVWRWRPSDLQQRNIGPGGKICVSFNVILHSIWAEGISQPPTFSSRFIGLFVLLFPVFPFLSRVCFCFSSFRCAPGSRVALITQAFRSLFIEKRTSSTSSLSSHPLFHCGKGNRLRDCVHGATQGSLIG